MGCFTVNCSVLSPLEAVGWGDSKEFKAADPHNIISTNVNRCMSCFLFPVVDDQLLSFAEVERLLS